MIYITHFCFPILSFKPSFEQIFTLRTLIVKFRCSRREWDWYYCCLYTTI